MKREKIEEQIAATAMDIDICNRKIAEVFELAKERDRLREKLGELTRWYTGECFRERLTEDMKQCIFAYKGKTKDLSEALASQIRKAQKIHPSSF
ncbi:MAG: hypothetical protein GX303_07555 [Clostridiales bacterium]|nr:hypothetical protein [Clostridiales bacterium]